jgi:hypothetical protein
LLNAAVAWELDADLPKYDSAMRWISHQADLKLALVMVPGVLTALHEAPQWLP